MWLSVFRVRRNFFFSSLLFSFSRSSCLHVSLQRFESLYNGQLRSCFGLYLPHLWSAMTGINAPSILLAILRIPTAVLKVLAFAHVKSSFQTVLARTCAVSLPSPALPSPRSTHSTVLKPASSHSARNMSSGKKEGLCAVPATAQMLVNLPRRRSLLEPNLSSVAMRIIAHQSSPSSAQHNSTALHHLTHLSRRHGREHKDENHRIARVTKS